MIEVTNPTELRKKMKEKLDAVSKEKRHLIVHRSRDEDIIMLPLSEYNAWRETAHLLSTEANRKHLRESMEQAEKGETIKVDVHKLWK